MRSLLFTAIAVVLFSCNDAADTKYPNQAMDDTARMRDPAPQTLLFNRVFLTTNEIPSVIKIKGKFVEASKWTDSSGENYIILSSEGPFDDKGSDGEEDGETVELYAAHYVQKGNDYPKVWSIQEAVKTCPFDITAKFIPGSTTITDLDKDGVAEVKVQYLHACRSDVSPAAMELVMAENGKSYKLSGFSWVQYSAEFKFDVNESNVNLEKYTDIKEEQFHRFFGRYKNEREFAGAPPEFIAFARKEWLKHVMEKMGE